MVNINNEHFAKMLIKLLYIHLPGLVNDLKNQQGIISDNNPSFQHKMLHLKSLIFLYNPECEPAFWKMKRKLSICFGKGTIFMSICIFSHNFSFDQFRTLGANAQQSFINTRTVPINIQVKGNAVFNFSGPAGILNPNTGIQNMKVAISSPATGTAIALSAAYQNIPGATSLAVPVKNTETDILTYSLSPSDLVAGFMQSGTYSNSIYSQITDSRSLPSNPAPAVNLVTPLSIQVADLQEIRLNQTVINLAFNNLADYQNGIAVNSSNHITISKTNPFDVYVKSNTNVLVIGTNSIPVSCLQIGPASGQTDMLPITLSTTAQKVISGAKPCLDRNFNVKYSIAADKVPLLLGKPPGTYTTTVTYSFTAP